MLCPWRGKNRGIVHNGRQTMEPGSGMDLIVRRMIAHRYDSTGYVIEQGGCVLQGRSWQRSRLRRWVAGGLVLLASGAMLASCGASSSSASVAMVRRVGVVNAMAIEQAPILAAMRITGSTIVAGYRFFLGTIDGVPVVEVRSGEKEYAAEMAATIMDSHFALRAALLTGIAGSRNPAVNVGDVVLGAYVVDKSSIHFHDRGFLSPYTGVEMEITSHSNVLGALVGGHGQRGPNSRDAKSFGIGPSSVSKSYVYLEDLAASAQLVHDAVEQGSHVGSIPLAAATGEKKLHGVLHNRVLVGVIGSANQWTEPLVDQEIQNALYETDAGENEGMGFAYTNARFGVPWLIVRGISDSPWYPSTYDPLVAARRAATVAVGLIKNLPARISPKPASLSLLSPESNAARAGYIVATKVQLSSVGTPEELTYVSRSGATISKGWPFASEYASGAGTAQSG